MLFSNVAAPKLSGERFFITYGLSGNEAEAYAIARDICLEQTVEFPEELVPEGFIQDSIVGRIESFVKRTPRNFQAVISYAVETTANELPQLLNVVFGNISIKRGIRVEDIQLSASLVKNFQGPRWGQAGIRKLLGVSDRPLLATALKPMGLPVLDLANLAYDFAMGGIDIIKDDHGLTNQSFTSFLDRIRSCAKAVAKANKSTGRNAIYVPNITAPYHETIKRAKQAKTAGAGGLLISPGLAGWDAVRAIAGDDSIALPLFCHPAFLGSYVLHDSGIAHPVLFGQIPRIAGADASIYPNFGGRFSFSLKECQSILQGANMSMGGLKSIFPTPAGGINLNNIPELLKIYGNDVIFLVGGGLFKHSPNLIDNCRYFRDLV